jgi:hypothetical protein
VHYLVFIAVCAVGLSRLQCDRASATDWVAAPEPQPSLGACMIHGVEYAAQSRLVVAGKTWPRIYCVPPTSIGKQNIG